MQKVPYKIAVVIICLVLFVGGVYSIANYTTTPMVNTVPTATSTTPVPLANPPLTQGKSSLMLTTPRSGAFVSSPLLIEGSAKGMYFEASFPVELHDENGIILSRGIATAEGDWMTAEYIPFTASLTFTRPQTSQKGTLIFKKDNPSGLPEHDVTFEIPVRF